MGISKGRERKEWLKVCIGSNVGDNKIEGDHREDVSYREGGVLVNRERVA